MSQLYLGRQIVKMKLIENQEMHNCGRPTRCTTIIQVCEFKDFKRIERDSCRL